MAEGIFVRHSRKCRSGTGGRCNCKPTFQAHVWDRRTKRRIRKSFPTEAAAKSWRHDALVGLRKRTMKPPTNETVAKAASALIAGMDDGSIRNRSGEVYKPSTARSYADALRLHVVPEMGHCRLSDLGRGDCQDFADRLAASGMTASAVRNTLMPLKVIFRRAVRRGDIAVNPTSDLELAAVKPVEQRVAPPPEAAALINAVPASDRATWAMALYAGLRRGELQALEWASVDFDVGVIRVTAAWDRVAGAQAPKYNSVRTVPMPPTLRTILLEHRLGQGRGGNGLVLGRTATKPFAPDRLQARADKRWGAAGLERITLHQCRHSYASMMIAAQAAAGRFNAKALSAFLGHSSIQVTFDRYGHLFPGGEAEAGVLFEEYLAGASQATARSIGGSA